MHHVILLVAI